LKRVKGVKKYAKQFLKAVDLGEVPQALAQYTAVASLMDKDRGFKNLMMSPMFSLEERNKVITFVADKVKMSSEALKFLKYLSDMMIIGALQEIIKAIITLYLEMKKRVKAVVTAPAAISKAYEEQLIASLKQITGRDVDLESAVDPSLLGGVRIQVGSTMYDSSIKGQLGLLRDKLIKG
jgi:ATP synthase F1 delta subunit